VFRPSFETSACQIDDVNFTTWTSMLRKFLKDVTYWLPTPQIREIQARSMYRNMYMHGLDLLLTSSHEITSHELVIVAWISSLLQSPETASGLAGDNYSSIQIIPKACRSWSEVVQATLSDQERSKYTKRAYNVHMGNTNVQCVS
jgi:hypothetical protein